MIALAAVDIFLLWCLYLLACQGSEGGDVFHDFVTESASRGSYSIMIL